MRTSNNTRTFGQVTKIIANDHGLPENIMFFSDKEVDGNIYMKDMIVLDTLFPMKTAFISGKVPEIYVILQRNMSTLDYIDDGSQLKEQAHNIEEEYEKLQTAKQIKAKKVEQKRNKEREFDDMKNKSINKKHKKAIITGFFSMLLFMCFIWLLLDSASTLNRVHENLQMRLAVTGQFFRETKINDLPIYFRERNQLISYINGYEDFLKDHKNNFFRDNTLLPWIQVQVYRVSEAPCEEFFERPGIGEFHAGQTCQASSAFEEYVEDEFDGAQYIDHGFMKRVYTKFNAMPDAGNRRDILIYG